MSETPDYLLMILSHGRPDNIKTLGTLRQAGYTGPWVIVIDDEDPTADDYYRIHGEDRVVMFSKQDIAQRFDQGDNFNDRRCIVYARNAAYDLAQDLGYRYFLQFDDDYRAFEHRFGPDHTYNWSMLRDLDGVLDAMVTYYAATPTIGTIAMAQGGDFIGGQGNDSAKQVGTKRKAMNSFICDTERRFWFPGRLNEDVNAYTELQRRGLVMFTTHQVSLVQTITQSNEGGMSDMYLDGGTYQKSFYSVMRCPSGVKISVIESTNRRIHHLVDYRKTAPQILHERHRKAA